MNLDLRSTSDRVVRVEENEHVYHVDGGHRDEIDETVDEHPVICGQQALWTKPRGVAHVLASLDILCGVCEREEEEGASRKDVQGRRRLDPEQIPKGNYERCNVPNRGGEIEPPDDIILHVP